MGRWNSKLVPHTELIRQLRDQGVTYRQISLELGKIGVTVHPDTINSFVTTRAIAAKNGWLPLKLPPLVDI